MTPRVGAALVCPGCGAQLRLQGRPTVVACRYCGAHILTSLGTQTDQPAEAVAGRGLAVAVVVLLVAAPILIAAIAGVVILVVVISAHNTRTPPQPTFVQNPPNFGGIPVTTVPGAKGASAPCGKGNFTCAAGEVCLVPVTPGNVAPGTCMDSNLCAYARSQQPAQISCKDRKGKELP